MRGRRLRKLFDAINLLAQPCGATIGELGRRLDVDRRQVYRTIETLQDDFCFLVVKEKSGSGEIRYHLEPGQYRRLADMQVADLNLTLSEVIALHFLKGQAKLYAGTDVGREIDRAFAKLETFMPVGLPHTLEQIRSLFIPAVRFAKEYSGAEAAIDTLTGAMLKRHTCRFTYHSFTDDQVRQFRIDPLAFFERDGGLYCFVRATSFGDIIVLAVERTSEITSTDETFAWPDGFDPDDLLANAFGLHVGEPVTVKIRFSADQARYIRERRWAPRQTLTPRDDGGVVLELTTSGWWDVKRWVLGFGAEAEVMEPGELREEIAAELRGALEQYLQP